MRAKRNSMPFSTACKVLVNLLPHTPDTEGILNRATFAKLARRRVSGEPRARRRILSMRICCALESGQIAAATLDVFPD